MLLDKLLLSIPKQLKIEIQNLVDVGIYESQTAFIVQAIRDKIVLDTGKIKDGLETPMMIGEDDFWKETIKIIEKNVGYMQGRHQLYCNEFKDVSFCQFRNLLDRHKQLIS